MSTSNGFAVLRHRNFSFYLAARILGTLAVQMQNVAVGWQVYSMTHNLFYLGMIGLAQFAPFLLLILPAGHAADRYNRRNIVTACLATQLVVGLLLLAFARSGMAAVWPVFAVLVLFGSARAFMGPATQAMLVNLVPQQDFSKAVALSSSSFHVAVILGPSLGGLLYIYGPVAVYSIAAALLLVATVLMASTQAPPQATRREPATWHSVLEGLRFVMSRPIVLGAISLDLFAVLFGGATACCRRWPTTCFTRARMHWACCAARPAPAPRCARSRWHSFRSRAGSAPGCSAAWPCSAWGPWCWAPPPPLPSPSPACC
jgi:MFS family permease